MFKILVCESIATRKCLSRVPAIGSTSHHPLTLQNHQQKRNFTQNFWLSLSASKPVAIFQEATIQLHDITGMPWWSTIIVSTFLLRGCVTFPLALYQSKILSKVERLSKEEMPEIAKEMKVEMAMAIKKFNWDEKTAKIMFARSMKKQWKNLIVRDNCHPAKSLVLILFQIPLWITQSCALRNMISMLPDPSNLNAQIVCAEMSLGGLLWIPNLIEPDHSFILPVFLGVLNLAIVEISLMSKRVRNDTKLSRYGTYFFRTLSVALVPIAAFVPSGLSLYWVTSSTFGLLQNLVILSPKLRRTVGIPKVESELEQPYKHLYNKIKERLGIQ